ncbi:hypothetical protein Scep_018802 [Stephania cephalantha]|uniref:Uncharacterized protein n=1 Tax=Stephania cephalantha TaxID=152367 RepID=A0AAP0I9Q0_9MAGN
MTQETVMEKALSMATMSASSSQSIPAMAFAPTSGVDMMKAHEIPSMALRSDAINFAEMATMSLQVFSGSGSSNQVNQ